MTLESSLVTALKTVCPRVYPDLAPINTATPYVTWQGIGGASIRFIDNAAGDKRNVLVQVNVWSTTRAEALSLARAIEDALCAAADMQADPMGEPISIYEDETQLYGCHQRISIWATR